MKCPSHVKTFKYRNGEKLFSYKITDEFNTTWYEYVRMDILIINGPLNCEPNIIGKFQVLAYILKFFKG